VRNIAISVSDVYMHVCPLAHLKTALQTSRNFLYCYPWPWIDPVLTSMRGLCTSGFMDDVMLWHDRAESKTALFCRDRQTAAPVDHLGWPHWVTWFSTSFT